ncbi:hypothetical protein [Streptomyces sp. NBC_00091]|uniref:hypothetical protein n=1 Tax=Streptomyces sp. NBC_00091 TaxID=2975648 RepID=UPI002255A295|nr:hypothetical protein [Streptomyces sp. NBC_00091]MCX5377376.1 hypothetical protein [Streptomyces sp. NBC_00091]
MRIAMNAGRAKRWSKLAAIPVGVLASGAMVLGATHATVTASAWNDNNTLASGKWTKATVSSSKPNAAVVNVSGLTPDTPAAWTTVKYTFNPDPDAAQSAGRLLFKDVVAKDAKGNVVDIKNSELAKHLHLGFEVQRQGQFDVVFEEERTVADWLKDDATGLTIKDQLPLKGKGKDADKEKGKFKLTNRYDLQLSWYLDKDAPAEAQNSGITFTVGAELDETEKKA